MGKVMGANKTDNARSRKLGAGASKMSASASMKTGKPAVSDTKGAGNRAHLRQAFGLKILKTSHPDIRRLKRQGYEAEIHGNRFWNSTYLLMDYLSRQQLPRRFRVLEIGCGWGLLGLYCNRKFGCWVHGIDADDKVLPYLQLHAELNNLKMSAEKKKFSQLTINFLKQFDLILGADICFWPDLSNDLFNLMGRARKAGVKQVMIVDPRRPPFNRLARRCKKEYGDTAEVVEKTLRRPVNASGDILIVNNG